MLNPSSLLASSLLAPALLWQCEAKVSYGKQTPTIQALSLVIEDHKATLTTETFTYTSGILNKYGNHYDYAEQQTSSVENERVTTATMLRFNAQQGVLVFFDHTFVDRGGSRLVTGKCQAQ